MLSNEQERLERRAVAKAEAVETVEANHTEAVERLVNLRKEAGYPDPVTGKVTPTAEEVEEDEESEEDEDE